MPKFMKPRKLRSRPPLRVLSPNWDKFLHQLRKDIFDCAFDIDICGFQTIGDLAAKAGVCYNTVANLFHGITKEPRLHTIFKLCRAIKMDMGLVREGLMTAAMKDSAKQLRRSVA